MRRLKFVLIFIQITISNPILADSPLDTNNYPNVWEWQPKYPPKEWAYISFRPLPDNDVLISFSNNDSLDRKSETAAFFKKRKYKSAESAFGVPLGSPRLPTPPIFHPLKLPNGKTIRSYRSDKCGKGIYSGIRIGDSEYNTLVEKSVILFLEKPRFFPSAICEENEIPGFYHKVVIFNPSRFFPLEDNTFLVSDMATGTVLRFDEEINTLSPLLGDKLFLVEYDKIIKFSRKYISDHSPDVNWEHYYEELGMFIKKIGATK